MLDWFCSAWAWERQSFMMYIGYKAEPYPLCSGKEKRKESSPIISFKSCQGVKLK